MPIPHNRYRMLLIEQIIEEECGAHDSPHFQLPFYRAQPAGTLPDA
ncbi:MAG: hypothetical protein QOK23_4324, partial [Gammaproteobacteria bacterium]|nr:hypothetical protein [Gammaproteobacteria bacterium]